MKMSRHPLTLKWPYPQHQHCPKPETRGHVKGLNRLKLCLPGPYLIFSFQLVSSNRVVSVVTC